MPDRARWKRGDGFDRAARSLCTWTCGDWHSCHRSPPLGGVRHARRRATSARPGLRTAARRRVPEERTRADNRADRRGDPAARRKFHSPRGGRPRGIRSAVSERRPDLSQRLLALEGSAVRSRPLRGRPLEVSPLRPARRRAGVL